MQQTDARKSLLHGVQGSCCGFATMSDIVVGTNPTMRIRSPLTHCTLLQTSCEHEGMKTMLSAMLQPVASQYPQTHWDLTPSVAQHWKANVTPSLSKPLNHRRWHWVVGHLQKQAHTQTIMPAMLQDCLQATQLNMQHYCTATFHTVGIVTATVLSPVSRLCNSELMAPSITSI